MIIGYDLDAPKRPVNMSLNEDLVRKAREMTDNLSDQVEKLLADYVLAEQKRRADEAAPFDAALGAWNEFDRRFGSFADEHSTL